MSEHPAGAERQQQMFETEDARTLLDQLIADSRLYTRSAEYKALLDFVVRLRNFAPFNAMLLQVQKPGLTYAASARDWQDRFRRTPKEGARPLLILWPFGPVALVYDVMDTEGEALPADVAAFFATGAIDQGWIASFLSRLTKRSIECQTIDAGDGAAGSIRVVKRGAQEKDPTQYRMQVNRNHSPSVQFATLVHELGHLFLGHLGPDKVLNVPERRSMGHRQVEVEAESVSFLVCARNGVTSKAEAYLSAYVAQNTTVDEIDLYQIMRAAGQVESILGLTAHTSYR